MCVKASYVCVNVFHACAPEPLFILSAGDKILSLNRENLAHVGGDAVKKKFKEAQRQNDHVLLALLRNGKELKCEPLSSFHLEYLGCRTFVQLSIGI
jgi:hypothetical protein